MAVKILSLLILVSFNSIAKEECSPQAPRDISNNTGLNKSLFKFAPSFSKLNLCNIHFHSHAEHKGPGFSVYKGKRVHGGYACNEKVDLSLERFLQYKNVGCKGIETGLTVEVHWVYSSCDIEPGPTLESCLARNCKNPILRVESQVFLLVNDDNAQSFEPYSKLVKQNNYHQTADLPSRENAVEYLGSTTGPNYNKYCSPYEVSWSVNPKCSELNIKSLDNFCKKNVFKEKYSHGVRNLVIDPKMLSTIGK